MHSLLNNTLVNVAWVPTFDLVSTSYNLQYIKVGTAELRKGDEKAAL